MKSDPQLRRWYLGYNRELFESYLPDDDTVSLIWEPCGGAVAETHFLDDNDFLIKINPCLRGVGSRPRHSCARLAQIHEMAHVKVAIKHGYRVAHHGKLFDEEIQRLTKYKSYRKLL